MKIYLDTNIPNHLFTLVVWEGGREDSHYTEAKEFDKENNLIALQYILELDIEWNLRLGTSRLMTDEIKKWRMKINARYEKEKFYFLNDVYKLLKRIPIKDFDFELETTLDASPSIFDKIYYILKGDKPNKNDIRHLIAFKKSGYDVFLTMDFKSILKHKRELDGLNINVQSPLGFLNEFLLHKQPDYSKDNETIKYLNGLEGLNFLRRVLHGAWTKPKKSEFLLKFK